MAGKEDEQIQIARMPEQADLSEQPVCSVHVILQGALETTKEDSLLTTYLHLSQPMQGDA